MAKYTVKLTQPPRGHQVPPLLEDVGDWMGQQTHGTLGWFDALAAEAIPREWNPEKADRLRRDAFAFMSLPDGSLLALVNTGAKAPHAVALLGSEGEARTVANSLEEFLLLWSQGETEIAELDDEEGASGRKALASWLKAKKVKAPKAKAFDFAAWLDGDAALRSSPTSPPRGGGRGSARMSWTCRGRRPRRRRSRSCSARPPIAGPPSRTRMSSPSPTGPGRSTPRGTSRHAR